MCGIVGIMSLGDHPVARQEIGHMCDAIVHRGPDDEGSYIAVGIGLGMRRLSIIDLATGHQPVRNEDGSVWVVFNGEIYNFKELRDDLEHRGHSFYTSTDTEVIAHLYEESGPRCVEKMRGMFTFAVWDETRKTLLLARDRLGVKPLYYTEAGGRLAFASELKSLLRLPEVERRINWASFDYLLSSQYTPATESLIEGVHKLEAGHILIAGPGRRPTVQRYWDVCFEPDYNHDEEYFVERLRELLLESVRLRLVSDVPLGAFLSGGIDSSSVVAMMTRLASAPVKTFSIGFKEVRYNELAHARIVAERFGTEHHELVLEPDALALMDELAWYLDEPLGDPSCIPTYMVSRLAADHVKVVLSGDGGDEIFAGYEKYLVEERERRHYIPAPARKALAWTASLMPLGMKGRNLIYHYSLDGHARYLDSLVLFPNEDKQALLRREIREILTLGCQNNGYGAFADKGHWLSSVQYLDIHSYLPLDILTKVDRMSMACSIEAREPLLDHKLVEFAATIPPELKLRQGDTKYIFKRALRGILPDTIINRPKQGFAVPLEDWFRGNLASFVRDLLLSSRSSQRGIFEPSYIEKLLRIHEQGRRRDIELWTLISFELWCRTFLDRAARWPDSDVRTAPLRAAS
ncbi:MAG TPA: asparagine synthase (glutamine-hydrolyzing) [Verrucomicrobiae bacterium]|jgi:asparagine synthase (glutamine-hydrolysing)|nr:asparagine synthase (glutamine-hydrolyzing) [Verrucomicrobiae bacterium]